MRGLVRRAYRLCLWLYPPAFRRRYGPSMLADFDDAAGRSSVPRLARLLLRDGIGSLASQWRASVGAGSLVDGVGLDLRVAGRQMGRQPVVNAAIVLTLALGLGLGTVVYGMVQATLWPTSGGNADPRAIVTVFNGKERLRNVSYPDFEDLRGAGALEALTAARLAAAHLDGGDGVRRITVALVSPQFFELFGVAPARGAVWNTSAPGRLALLAAPAEGDAGETIRLNGLEYEVAGVLPAGFRGPWLDGRPDVWVPLATLPDFVGFAGAPVDGSGERVFTYRGYNAFQVFGRRPQGLSDGALASRLDAVAAGIREVYPEYPIEFSAAPASWAAFRADQRDTVGAHARAFAGVAITVWVAALANAALLLALALVARQRELEVRTALGAQPGRLVRLFVVQGSVLGLAAGALALVLTRLAVPWTGMLDLPAGVRAELTLDVRLVIVAAAAALLTGLALGLLSGVAATRLVRGTLNPSSDPARAQRLAQGAVVVQVAASFTLLVGAAMLTRSVANLSTIDLGFRPENVVVANFELEPLGYDRNRGLPLLRQLLADLSSHPDIEAVTLGSGTPLEPQPGFQLLHVPGHDDGDLRDVSQALVGPDYFRSIGVAVREGREFAPTDDEGSPGVIVVNAGLAQRLWPDAPAVGRRVATSPDGPWFTVVGVVDDYHHDDLRRVPQPRLYWPLLQMYAWAKGGTYRTLIARGRASDEAILDAMQAAVRRQDPALPLYQVDTLHGRIRAATARERQAAALLASLSSLATVLTAVGLTALLSYWVGRRRRELGIRLALGAPVGNVRALVVRRAALLATAGSLLGLVGARGLSGLLGGLLYDVGPFDAAGFGFAAVAFGLLALAAAWLPARRAAAVDPAVTLRDA